MSIEKKNEAEHNEKGRQVAETEREKAETGRVAAEDAREVAEGQRQLAEELRKTAEELRAAAVADRDLSEELVRTNQQQVNLLEQQRALRSEMQDALDRFLAAVSRLERGSQANS